MIYLQICEAGLTGHMRMFLQNRFEDSPVFGNWGKKEKESYEIIDKIGF